jgi:hypothetical protein
MVPPGRQTGWVVFGDNVIDLPGEVRRSTRGVARGGQSRAPVAARGLERRRPQVFSRRGDRLKPGVVGGGPTSVPGRQAKQEPASGPRTSRTACVHVGNAHIDPVWPWRWQDGWHQVRATFGSALELRRSVVACTASAHRRNNTPRHRRRISTVTTTRQVTQAETAPLCLARDQM